MSAEHSCGVGHHEMSSKDRLQATHESKPDFKDTKEENAAELYIDREQETSFEHKLFGSLLRTDKISDEFPEFRVLFRWTVPISRVWVQSRLLERNSN